MRNYLDSTRKIMARKLPAPALLLRRSRHGNAGLLALEPATTWRNR